METLDTYMPRDAKLQELWLILPEESRAGRVAEAKRREAVVLAVQGRPAGESVRAAACRAAPGTHRSNVLRWVRSYRESGFEGLISRRRAPPPAKMPEAVRVALCTLRQMDPQIDVGAMCAHVEKFHGYKASATVVKRVLNEAGLARRPGAPSKCERVGEQRLELGGMKLVEAACVESGYLDVLARSVEEQVRDLPCPVSPRSVDVSGRDENGRFLPEFNERFRKGPEDVIGPGFASVEEKREGLDPERLQVGQVGRAIIERKLVALLVSPLLGGGRWDGIRVSRGELLGELCGEPYMPATLDRFTRELKYAGVANTLWETHARLWLKVTSLWGDPQRAVVLYVDGTTKPLWTQLFSESAKVSCVGRTMPAIEQVAFHSGYGVPVWMLTCSGHAPLVKEVPKALERMEQEWGGSSVGRIVVIDAEGNSVPFLKGLELAGRAWVTRLRPGWVESKRIFNRNNYRPYRDGDRVRSGVADFNDPDGGTFRMRVIEIERRTKGNITYLGASMMLRVQDWKPQELADIYFDRWPAQEANFKAINQAVGLKEVHGYGKQLVDNISVLTELDELAGKIVRQQERVERLTVEEAQLQQRLQDEEKEAVRTASRKEMVGSELHDRVEHGVRLTQQLSRLSEEDRGLAAAVAAGIRRIEKDRAKLEKTTAARERTEATLDKHHQRQVELESRRTIFKHDVELDSIFTLLKVGMVLLVTYVLKEYLGDARMSAATFLDRVATLPARLRQMPNLEIVTFEYNRRDPEVMGLLASYAEAINARKLRMRSGKTLRIAVDPAPAPTRPPPPGSRRGTGDRFKR